MQLVVARVGKAHGLRGEVTLESRTDVPAERFAVGSVLETVPADVGPLTVTGARAHQGRWIVAFAEVADRSAAEELRGTEIVIDPDEADDLDEEDAWYPHELAGLRAELADGTGVGEVTGIEHLPAHDVLVIRETGGERTLVPFVRAIVPEVDVPGGRVVLTPPGGLLARDAQSAVVAAPDGSEEGED